MTKEKQQCHALRGPCVAHVLNAQQGAGNDCHVSNAGKILSNCIWHQPYAWSRPDNGNHPDVGPHTVLHQLRVVAFDVMCTQYSGFWGRLTRAFRIC